MNLKKYKKEDRGFIIINEAWYTKGMEKTYKEPSICVGFYDKQGGTDGEFIFVWEKIGVRLKAFNDSWKALNKMPELLKLMETLDNTDISVNEFAEMLKKLGYKDLTERIPPKKK